MPVIIQKIIPVLLINMLCMNASSAQSEKSWNGKDCAVVLTYDDALNVDLTNAIPALDSVGLKGTFYISDYFDGLKNQIPKWKKAAQDGHELANHTVWHPCEGGRAGREFVAPEHDLNNYTVARMINEIKTMNNLLYAMDGKTKRTFAYPCGDAKIHDTNYIDKLKNDFVAARGVKPEMLPINKIDLYNIGCYGIHGETGEQLINLVKQAMENHVLLVFLFHGVGGEHSLNVSLTAHSELLHFLQQHDKNIWIAPMIDVAEYIKQYQQKTDSVKDLKDYYKNYFPIGVAVGPANLHGDEADLIVKQFNSITPENAMKMAPIHPKENFYNWKDADSIVAFAIRNHLKIRGHNLCWHEQTPAWLFKDSSGKLVTKEILLKRLKEHITTVVNRYKGKIYAWDVVNEAIDDDSTKFLRNSLWYQICGEDFIAKAFEYAHEADPNAQLFYNDYNTERPEKMERIYKLMKKLTDAKVPINGIGLQAHWSIYEPSRESLENTIQKFSSLGLQVQITELDISIYKWEKNMRVKSASDMDVLTPELEQKQMEKYKMIFSVFRKYKDVITGVTFWNISDKHSWLDSYPVAGRKNFPLLFDKNLKPKKAFFEIINFNQ